MKSNLHNLSHKHLFSCRGGQLVPIAVIEALPGDSIKHATSALLRTQPLLAPVMHKVEVKIHHWYVPFRLLLTNWEDFITGGPDGTDATVLPFVTAPGPSGFGVSTLADYLGIPSGADTVGNIFSAFPFRAYTMIWNEFYRDQDLQDPLPISLAAGSDTTTNQFLAYSNWEKDYFTSARLEPQKGTDVALPLAGDAPVKGIGPMGTAQTTAAITIRETGETSGTAVTGWQGEGQSGTIGAGEAHFGIEQGGAAGHPNIRADLSQVTAASINDLRLATALQRYKENMMRFGSRYIERLRYFGVPPMDARLQLPEYLGGGKEVIQFSEVLQTAEGTDPVGEMRGHGIAAMRSNSYRRFIPEHGLIISLMTIRPRTMYVQAVNRMWLRRTKEDFFTPELAHIGQQEVYNGEIYAGAATQFGTWGYQDRYDDYRRQESRVSGEFRDTLNFWHMARDFATEPVLDGDFVQCTPTDRVFATLDTDEFYVQAIHNIRAKRKVPRVGNSLIF